MKGERNKFIVTILLEYCVGFVSDRVLVVEVAAYGHVSCKKL